MKAKIFIIIILAGVGLSCMLSSEARQAKIYRGELETMRGKTWLDVYNMIKEWDFEVMDSWKAESPKQEWIKEKNPSAVGFSDEEIQTTFSLEGNYVVHFYRKKNKASVASSGTINSEGQTVAKDDIYGADTFSIIRTVFRDDEFIGFKVWGNVGIGKLMEGTYRRYD